MANSPGYTLLDGNLLREVINPETRTNAFMLITPHGEIIHDSRPVRNVPVLAMCYSGVPLTVNYSDNDENDRVLGIVDDNLHSTLRNKSFESSSTKPSSRDPSKATLSKAAEFLAAKAGHDNPHHFKKITELKPQDGKAIYEELHLLASAVKEGDVQHHDSKKMAATGATKASDAHKSFLFSQAYPITKMVADNGSPIPLKDVVHPNKRYTLRVDDDGPPEVARGIDFEFKMNLFLPISKTNDVETRLEQLEKTKGIIIVTKDNCSKHRHIAQNVNGNFPDVILHEDSSILASWKIILLPIKGSKSEVTTYYMLPYRFHTLSGVPCIVFDLWHILCYNEPSSAYCTGGLSMTQTDIYMNLLETLGIQLVVGVDLTCNVVGTESGAWPLLTYDQLANSLQFQETMLQSIGGRPLSSRITELDLLPHFNHVVNELNDFLKNITDSKTLAGALESIHCRGRSVSRREHREFKSNDAESYLALHEYMKRLCGSVSRVETFNYEQQCIMVVKKEQTEKKSKSAAAAAAAVVSLTKPEACHLYSLVVPHQSVTADTMDQLRKYVKDNSIQFRLTDVATQKLREHFPKASDDVDEEYNLDPSAEIPSDIDNENKFIAFFDSELRLWVIPESKLAHHPNSTPCFYHKNIEPPNKYGHGQRRVVNAANISNVRDAEPDKSLGDKYTIVGLLSKVSRNFKPYDKFVAWWDEYKVKHKIGSQGGGKPIKRSNTRKRKPHKRARTKRCRRYKHKSLKKIKV
jgi:hypothetical protein